MSNFQACQTSLFAMPAPVIWPVWGGSTTAPVEFQPMPKRQAAKLYRKAQAHDRRTRQRGSGKHGGALGRIALGVYNVLLFDFMNHATGRLDPSIEAIADKASCGTTAVKNALRKLKEKGFLAWIRRAKPAEDENGGFLLRQETNAYAVLPETCWQGYEEPAPPTVEPWQWGATPPLPDTLARAAEELAAGGTTGSMIAILEQEPKNPLAAALARLGRTAGFIHKP
jgi:hypothetical protein